MLLFQMNDSDSDLEDLPPWDIYWVDKDPYRGKYVMKRIINVISLCL